MKHPQRLLILSGPTREAIDPVRYLSNASSGRQGFELAAEAARRGWEVSLVQGPVALEPPAGVDLHPVVTAREMLERARDLHPTCGVLIAVAAVCDYRPVEVLPQKHKRKGGIWRLDLVPNPDILAELAPLKEERIHVGFALETDSPRENARAKLRSKGLDWIVLNSPSAIGAKRAEFTLIGRDGTLEELGLLGKKELAAHLLDRIGMAPRANSAGG